MKDLTQIQSVIRERRNYKTYTIDKDYEIDEFGITPIIFCENNCNVDLCYNRNTKLVF